MLVPSKLSALILSASDTVMALRPLNAYTVSSSNFLSLLFAVMIGASLAPLILTVSMLGVPLASLMLKVSV